MKTTIHGSRDRARGNTLMHDGHVELLGQGEIMANSYLLFKYNK